MNMVKLYSDGDPSYIIKIKVVIKSKEGTLGCLFFMKFIMRYYDIKTRINILRCEIINSTF